MSNDTNGSSQQSRINALLEEVEGLRKDAERWRWWRKRFGALTCMQVASSVGLDLSRTYVTNAVEMDAVTDAAIDASLSSGRSGSGEVSNG